MITELGPVSYTATPPATYCCSKCGASGVKLWRLYQTFLNYNELTCAKCSGEAEGESIEGIDADGKIASEFGGRTDTIGWRVPAVPTVEGDTFWGYTSVPQAGCDWWYKLPTLTPNPEQE